METTLKATMSAELITIGDSDPISLAHDRMQAFNIRHLPVRAEDGRIVGILSDRDVQRAMRSRLKEEHGLKIETTSFDPAAKAADYMSWPVRLVDATEDLRAVAELMVEEKVSSVLVTEQSKPIGIVTSEDMLKVLLRFLDHEKGSPRLKALLPRELWVTG